MALVQTAVHLARVMAAVFANALESPVWTSIALTAGVFDNAVQTPAALTALVFAEVVLTLHTFLCRPGRQNFTHVAPRMHVADILNLSARTSFDSAAYTLTAFSAAPRARLRTVLLIARRRRAASGRGWRATAPR